MLCRPYALSALLLSCLLAVTVSCSDSTDLPDDAPEGGPLRTLTFVYMAAENSLADFSTADLVEMRSAADRIPGDCALLVFIDDKVLPRICRIGTKGGKAVCDTIYTFAEDFSSSKKENMRMVFEYVTETYPAENMNVVMWSHGSGWIRGNAAMRPMHRSIGVDNGGNNYSNVTAHVLEVEDVADVLEALPTKVRLLLFDACFMQGVETAYALRNSAEWILASPAEIPGDGAPYDLIMDKLFANPIDAEAVMRAYQSGYNDEVDGTLLSVVRCSAMQQLADATKSVVKRYFTRENEVDNRHEVFSYLPGGYFLFGEPYYPDYLDINAVMKSRLPHDEYQAWKVAFDRAVPYKCASETWYSLPHNTEYTVEHDVYSGMSMYLPCSNRDFSLYNRDFSTTEWYSATGWQQAGW